MAQGGKEVLQGMAFLAAIAAAVVCGVGLFFMGVDGNLSQTHFIRLGLSTLGAAMVAAVAGVFLVGAMEANEKKKDEAATSAAKHEPEAAESRST